MKALSTITITLVMTFSLGCKHNEFDAGYAAKKYCNCLQKERATGKDFLMQERNVMVS